MKNIQKRVFGNIKKIERFFNINKSLLNDKNLLGKKKTLEGLLLQTEVLLKSKKKPKGIPKEFRTRVFFLLINKVLSDIDFLMNDRKLQFPKLYGEYNQLRNIPWLVMDDSDLKVLVNEALLNRQ